MAFISQLKIYYILSDRLSLVQESGTILEFSNKTVIGFKLGYDEEIELGFSIGSSEGLKYDRIDVLSLLV